MSAAATASFTDLVGFDVDVEGNTVIIRTDGGDFVRSRNALSLIDGGDVDTECTARSDGVFAQQDGALVAYMTCDGTGDPTHLSIRRSNLGSPTLEDFNDCSHADEDVFLNGFSEAGGDDAGQLGRQGPLGYFFQSSHIGGIDACRIYWGYASLAGILSPDSVGRIGVNGYAARNSPAVDLRGFDEVQFSTQIPQDFCTGLEDNEQGYMAAVADGHSTRTYDVTLQHSAFDGTPLPEISAPFTFSSAYGGAVGVACGGPRVAVQNGGGVFVLGRQGGSHVFTYDAPNSDSRGVALSELFPHPLNSSVDVQYVAFKDAGTVRVANVTSGLVVAEFEVPSGTWRGIRMDVAAQNVWVFTSTTVARFEVFNQTTEVPVNPSDVIDPQVEVEPEPEGILGGAGQTVGDALGTGAFGGNLFLGAVLIGLVSVGAGGGVPTAFGEGRRVRWNWGAALAGAIIGFLLAWAFGFFDTIVVFSAVVLAAVVGSVFFFRGR